MKTYQLTIGDQQRDLPIVPISDDTAIASFVLLGDDAMSYTAAKLLLPKSMVSGLIYSRNIPQPMLRTPLPVLDQNFKNKMEITTKSAPFMASCRESATV